MCFALVSRSQNLEVGPRLDKSTISAKQEGEVEITSFLSFCTCESYVFAFTGHIVMEFLRQFLSFKEMKLKNWEGTVHWNLACSFTMGGTKRKGQEILNVFMTMKMTFPLDKSKYI